MVSYLLLYSGYINVEHSAVMQIFVILQAYVDAEYSLLWSYLCCVWLCCWCWEV